MSQLEVKMPFLDIIKVAIGLCLATLVIGSLMLFSLASIMALAIIGA